MLRGGRHVCTIALHGTAKLRTSPGNQRRPPFFVADAVAWVFSVVFLSVFPTTVTV